MVSTVSLSIVRWGGGWQCNYCSSCCRSKSTSPELSCPSVGHCPWLQANRNARPLQLPAAPTNTKITWTTKRHNVVLLSRNFAFDVLAVCFFCSGGWLQYPVIAEASSLYSTAWLWHFGIECCLWVLVCFSGCCLRTRQLRRGWIMKHQKRSCGLIHQIRNGGRLCNGSLVWDHGRRKQRLACQHKSRYIRQ